MSFTVPSNSILYFNGQLKKNVYSHASQVIDRRQQPTFLFLSATAVANFTFSMVRKKEAHLLRLLFYNVNGFGAGPIINNWVGGQSIEKKPGLTNTCRRRRRRL
jgi:hypothetical protein